MKGESKVSFEVFECKQKGKTPPDRPREVKKPNPKIFRLLAYSKQRSKSALEQKKFLESSFLSSTPIHTSLNTTNITPQSPLTFGETTFSSFPTITPKPPARPPGYIPSTSTLNDTSKVIKIRRRHVNTKEVIQSSKIMLRRTLNIDPHQAKLDQEKQKIIEEQQDAINELHKFEERDRSKQKTYKQEQLRADEMSKDSQLKSMNIHPTSIDT